MKRVQKAKRQKLINKKARKRFLIALVLFSLFIINLIPSNTIKAEISEGKIVLDDIEAYNAVIFGDHRVEGADSEGRLAIQNNIYAQKKYDIAVAAQNPNTIVGDEIYDLNNPTIILGGKVEDGSGEIQISAGPLVINSESNENKLKWYHLDKKSVIKKTKSEIDSVFESLKVKANKTINDALKYETIKPIIPTGFMANNTIGLGESTENSRILVSKLLTDNVLEVKDVYIPNLENKDFIIIKSNAETINFQTGAIFHEDKVGGSYNLINKNESFGTNNNMAPIDKVAPKIIWVFPNAKDINVSGYAVIGSVFAPNATVRMSSNINGQLVAKNLLNSGGAEMHNWTLAWSRWRSVNNGVNVQIKKVDTEGSLLSGAKFEILDKDKNLIKTLETGLDGVTEIFNIEPGDYYYKEIKFPLGYEGNTNEVLFKVEANNLNIKIVEVVNTKIKEYLGEVKLIKTQEGNEGIKLSGAKFNLYKEDNTLVKENLATDSNGEIVYKTLKPGKYYFKETEAPKGYILNNSKINFEIKLGEQSVQEIVNVTNKKVEQIVYASLGNYIWEDINYDGKQGEIKKGIEGIKLILLDSLGNEIASTVTDENGFYKFDKLLPGAYKVKIVEKEGYILTESYRGYKHEDSDFNEDGVTKEIVLSAGENNETIDGGFYRLGSIGNKVWYDENKNGVQDNNEKPVVNMEVILIDSQGNKKSVKTDQSGLYIFENLKNGQYEVKFVKDDSKYEFTKGENGKVDEDSNPVSNNTVKVSLGYAENNTTIDAGLIEILIGTNPPVIPEKPTDPKPPTKPAEPIESVEVIKPEQPSNIGGLEQKLPQTGQAFWKSTLIIGVMIIIVGIFMKRKARS